MGIVHAQLLHLLQAHLGLLVHLLGFDPAAAESGIRGTQSQAFVQSLGPGPAGKGAVEPDRVEHELVVVRFLGQKAFSVQLEPSAASTNKPSAASTNKPHSVGLQ